MAWFPSCKLKHYVQFLTAGDTFKVQRMRNTFIPDTKTNMRLMATGLQRSGYINCMPTLLGPVSIMGLALPDLITALTQHGMYSTRWVLVGVLRGSPTLLRQST